MTNFGYVVLHGTDFGEEISVVGHGVFKPSYGPDFPATRLREIAEFFEQLVEMHARVDAVAMEGYSRGSMARREEAGELGGALRMKALGCQETDKMGELYVVAPGTLKKFACGKGNVGKVEVALSVARKWSWLMGPDLKTEHEADAMVLAMMAMLKGLYNSPSVERNSIEGVLAYEEKILDGLEPARL